MALPVIEDGFLCAYRGSLYSAQSFEWTFAVLGVGLDAGQVADAIKDPYTDDVAPEMCNVVSITSVAVTPLDGVGAQVVSSLESTGGHGDGDLTPETCIVVTLRTGIAGRSNRGRVFLPAVKGADLATGKYQWSSGYVGAVTAAMEAWSTALAVAGCTLSVLSRVESSMRQVTEVQARTPVGTQRRRLRGGLVF